MKERGQLHDKLNKIRAAVHYLQKTGKNKAQNYNYATEADTVAAIRKEMIDLGVSLVLSSVMTGQREIQGRNGPIPIIGVRMSGSWVDCETGYAEPFEFDGEGMDSGDKAVYKAHTGAEKYLLLKTFLIPTGDDPERDMPEEADDKAVEKYEAKLIKQGMTPEQAKKAAAPVDEDDLPTVADFTDVIMGQTTIEKLNEYEEFIKPQTAHMSTAELNTIKVQIQKKRDMIMTELRDKLNAIDNKPHLINYAHKYRGEINADPRLKTALKECVEGIGETLEWLKSKVDAKGGK